MSNIYWILPAYFAIGLALLEGIRWARTKWKIEPMDKIATAMVFGCWPVVIFISLMLIWRDKK